MSLDPTIWVAVIALTGTLVGHWVGRRQRAADAQGLAAKAAAVVQDTYQELISDLEAQVQAAHRDVASARAAARDAQRAADLAEHQAWKAQQEAQKMARFLTELRPLIAQYVPGAEPILERIDRLTAVAGAS